MKNSRRRFLKAAALLPAAAAAPALADGALAGEPAAPATPTAQQGLSDFVRARFGRHLTEAQFKEAQREVEGLLRACETIRRVPVEQTEEPAFVFIAEPQE